MQGGARRAAVLPRGCAAVRARSGGLTRRIPRPWRRTRAGTPCPRTKSHSWRSHTAGSGARELSGRVAGARCPASVHAWLWGGASSPGRRPERGQDARLGPVRSPRLPFRSARAALLPRVASDVEGAGLARPLPAGEPARTRLAAPFGGVQWRAMAAASMSLPSAAASGVLSLLEEDDQALKVSRTSVRGRTLPSRPAGHDPRPLAPAVVCAQEA